MRLFIAALFTPELKRELIAASERLRAASRYGNITRPDNIHLTFAFIGETNRIADIKRVMDKTAPVPFTLALSGSGAFHRDGGDIVWAGIKPDAAITAYAAALCDALRAEGFALDNKPFSPHITLGREVVCDTAPKLDIKPLSMECRRISLMRSERISGALRYTEIYGVNL